MSNYDQEQYEQFLGLGLTPIEIKMLQESNKTLTDKCQDLVYENWKLEQELDICQSLVEKKEQKIEHLQYTIARLEAHNQELMIKYTNV